MPTNPWRDTRPAPRSVSIYVLNPTIAGAICSWRDRVRFTGPGESTPGGANLCRAVGPRRIHSSASAPMDTGVSPLKATRLGGVTADPPRADKINDFCRNGSAGSPRATMGHPRPPPPPTIPTTTITPRLCNPSNRPSAVALPCTKHVTPWGGASGRGGAPGYREVRTLHV